MGKIKQPQMVKFIVGMITQDKNFFEIAQAQMTKLFGKIDFESEILPFTHTNYYEKEFGKDLLRKFVSFENLILPDELSKRKIATNKIEDELSENNKRKINLDPGYVSFSKLVLASTKDYFHRIYLGDGIYAEVTLFYKDKTFNPFLWTYPDYKTPEYINIFNHIREIYSKCLK